MKALVKTFVEFVDSHFEDVGPNFAREALKIHYGVNEARNIKGTSTTAEGKMLQEEGVTFMKLPMPDTPKWDA